MVRECARGRLSYSKRCRKNYAALNETQRRKCAPPRMRDPISSICMKHTLAEALPEVGARIVASDGTTFADGIVRSVEDLGDTVLLKLNKITYGLPKEDTWWLIVPIVKRKRV
jgi:hypothetical protein